jgi:tetratricopeptide (TPR) repeat protein
MIEIPAALVDRLKDRQAVLVAGLGCSELAGAPGWDELALRLCDWVGDDARKSELKAVVASGRRAAALAYLGARLPREAIVEVLREVYPPATEAPELLAAIARIPWRGLVSTGFDGLWAVAAGDAQPDLGVFLADQAAALREHRGRFLLELAGSTRAPESLSLGMVEGRRRLGASGIGAALRGLAERRCFVFAGFRPGDPDLAMVLQQIEGALERGRHFIFLPGARGLEADLLEAELGLTVIPYEGALDEVLRELEASWHGVAAQARPAEDDVDAWLEIMSRDPADPEPREVLSRAEAQLRADRGWERLVEVLLGRIELETDRTAQAAALREVARIYDAELASPDRAFPALAMALRLDPDAAGLVADAERAAGKAGLWGELAAEYAEVCEELHDAPTAVRHRLELARLYAEELDRVDDAVTAYRAVLARDPANATAAAALADLLSKQERWDELPAALAQAAELETDAGRAAELRLQLGELQAGRGGDADAAIATYQRVLADAARGSRPAASAGRAGAPVSLARALAGAGARAGDEGGGRRRAGRGGAAAARAGGPAGRAARRHGRLHPRAGGGAGGRPRQPRGAEGAGEAVREGRARRRLPAHRRAPVGRGRVEQRADPAAAAAGRGVGGAPRRPGPRRRRAGADPADRSGRRRRVPRARTRVPASQALAGAGGGARAPHGGRGQRHGEA